MLRTLLLREHGGRPGAAAVAQMLPVVGREQSTARRIWIRIPGWASSEPREFAKLFLAFFFAAYLFDHRDQLAVGGKKVLGLQLPRIKDLGPIIVVWIVSMGVLIMQHDLGTSLMFFAMFVAMLYAATGRKSWIIIGFIAFAAGAVLAAAACSATSASARRRLAAPVQRRAVQQDIRRLVAAGHRHFRPGLRRHDRHRPGSRASVAHHVRELRLHLRRSGRGAGLDRSDGVGHSDAVPADHRRPALSPP